MKQHVGFIWLIVFSLFVSTSSLSASVRQSLFPQPRPTLGASAAPSQTAERRIPSGLSAFAPSQSVRPSARPTRQSASRRRAAAHVSGQPRQTVRHSAEFDRWLARFRQRARREGIRGRVFDRVFAGVTPDMSVLRHERHQPEFSRPIWAYLDSAVSESRIRNGRRVLREHNRVLDAIERRYNVDREIVVAVWGMESAYGALRGSTRIIPALSALAMHSRRAEFYQEQLIGALRVIQSGDVDERHMVGSWAGAMGHTQFIPTSYLEYAVDFNGDGRRDIWSDDPTDSLASTAAYLSRHGWQSGQPWGVEVRIPRGFNPRLANTRRDVQDWISRGVQPVRGAQLPRSGEATLMFPAGSRGPAFLAFRNFRVIKRYNNADAYAIGVGHLADRLAGGSAFAGTWPRDDRPLNRSEREELQRILARSGHYSGTIDGRVGSGTLAGVREWQAANGLAPDGYVSFALLQRMRR